ncbi:hypothetical protein [Litorivivens sp.]|uniref:hypothetical protein n=1 Tax=Litorivivens sp. TaxID=2020868 RepID=UPI0035689045
MNALLATYLAFSYLPTDGAAQLLPGIHHSAVPMTASARRDTCATAWGKDYAIGQEITVGPLHMQCNYVSTWIDGDHQGNSVRWTVSAAH